jgi:hypothetical protein
MSPTPRPGLALFALFAVGLAACAPVRPNPNLPRLDLATRFGPDNVCGQGVSPAMAVRGAPAGTAAYRIRMSSMDVLAQRPWEQTVAVAGGDIAEGAAAGFPAPCLNEAQELLYRFEVMALDPGGRPLAYGQTTVFARGPTRTNDGNARGGPGPLPFDRAAGLQDGPFVLRDRGAANPAPSSQPASVDPLAGINSRIARPPPPLSAPVVDPAR